MENTSSVIKKTKYGLCISNFNFSSDMGVSL